MNELHVSVFPQPYPESFAAGSECIFFHFSFNSKNNPQPYDIFWAIDLKLQLEIKAILSIQCLTCFHFNSFTLFMNHVREQMTLSSEVIAVMLVLFRKPLATGAEYNFSCS